MVNAFYHGDYLSYEPVTIEIEPDCINIINFPGIDRSISNKSIEEGKRFVSRYYRNRRLGDFLKELDLSEGHSTGVPTIQEELEKNGSPKAIFHTDEDRRAMRIQIPIHPAFLNEKEDVNAIKTDNGGKGDGNGGDFEDLSENEKRVYLQVFEDGSQTAKQISDNTRIPKRTVERTLKSLKDNGIIMRIGSSRNGRWEPKEN